MTYEGTLETELHRLRAEFAQREDRRERDGLLFDFRASELALQIGAIERELAQELAP